MENYHKTSVTFCKGVHMLPNTLCNNFCGGNKENICAAKP